MQKNRLVMILVVLVILVVGGFTFIATNDSAINAASANESLAVNESSGGGLGFFNFGQKPRKLVEVDADGATETLDNIARDSADIKSRFRGVEENAAASARRFEQTDALIKQLTAQNKLLEAQIKSQSETITEMQLEPKGFDIDTIRQGIMSDLKNELEVFSPKSASGIVIQNEEPMMDEGTTRIRSINTLLDKRGQFDPVGANTLRNQKSPPNLNARADLGNEVSNGRRNKLKRSPYATSNHAANRSHSDSSDSNTSHGNNQQTVIDPRYTIFADSILNDAITLTALNGRVPKDGDINDPSPFKVIIGSDNLAANGFSIPNLKGMLMSGIVYGDKMLSCVRTKIKRATYIFEDGRGITFPRNASSNSNAILGYLTDAYGNPCIKGQYFTNEPEQLKKSFLAGLATGAANAYAAAQTSTRTNADGSSTLNVSGDKLKYLAGVGLAGGTNNVVERLEKERFDSWDSVVVPSGIRVAVHLEQTLELDQTSIQRRVVYVGTNNSQSFTD